MIVLDASLGVELVRGSSESLPLAHRILREPRPYHVPYLFDLEVVQALRRFVLTQALTPASGTAALHALALLPLQHHAHAPLIARVWELRDHVSVYDASYVALAESLGAMLLTRDVRLANVPGIRARVEVL